jgi:regulator of replication initiation timing
VVLARRNQLWILLSFFICAGLVTGLTIWQISRYQAKERELARVQNELKQATEQLRVIKDQNTVAISSRGKLQKDLTESKKQLATFLQQGVALEQKFKVLQEENSKLLTENSTLKVRLTTAAQQMSAMQQELKPSIPGTQSGRPVLKPSDLNPLIPPRQ